ARANFLRTGRALIALQRRAAPAPKVAQKFVLASSALGGVGGLRPWHHFAFRDDPASSRTARPFGRSRPPIRLASMAKPSPTIGNLLITRDRSRVSGWRRSAISRLTSSTSRNASIGRGRLSCRSTGRRAPRKKKPAQARALRKVPPDVA